MENINLKTSKLIFIIGSLSTILAHEQIDCSKYSSLFTEAKNALQKRESNNLNLDRCGFVTPDNVFGEPPSYDQCSLTNQDNANLHTIAAQIFKARLNMSLKQFQSVAAQCNFFQCTPCITKQSTTCTYPKYRPIDGRGVNAEHPEWGASLTPFARFAGRNFDDGIYTPPKSVTGAKLPSPRSIVQKILVKAVKATPPKLVYSSFAVLAILFVTHDLHYQIPVQPKNVQQEIRCCSKGHSSVSALPTSSMNSACYPLEISEDDRFYGAANITCLNMVRSQVGEYSGEVESGEIMNHATAYMDMSLIYGNHESEMAAIRSYRGGQFRMGPKNLLPVDRNRKYIPSMKRFTEIPIATLWPALFSKNHNHLAERLEKINPCWDDETIFQEARRINIATIQYNFITSKLLEGALNGRPTNEKYTGANPSVTIEFAIAYRGTHYYNYDWMSFLSENGTLTKVSHSDSIGHIEIAEDGFDAAIRSSIREMANLKKYSEELINKIGKNSAGYGVDLISTDIQRSREYGCPSYVEVRRKCNLKPQLNSFDDFYKVFNATNVDLLKSVYASYEDVDFYVGGVLEIFEVLGGPIVGPTFGCVIGLGHDSFSGGDIYYYSHPENPHPFTPDQINSVHNYNLSSIICRNTGLTKTVKIWPYQLDEKANPLVQCSDIPDIDLSPWKDARCKTPTSCGPEYP